MIVIICIVFSILSITSTLRHYWFNVWFPTLDAYLNAVLRSQSETKFVYLIRPWTQVWRQFWFINVFEIWAMYVITGLRFTLSVVQYQIYRWLTLYFHDCVSKAMVVGKKSHFAMLPVILAVSSLIHHDVIFSPINGRFTGLITSILRECSAFSILDEVILRDPSQITISDAKMLLI